jgi:hypothetical protein
MSHTTIASKINQEMRAFIVRAVHEVLNDPDFGLELSEQAKRRLRTAARAKKTISLSEIKRRYL